MRLDKTEESTPGICENRSVINNPTRECIWCLIYQFLILCCSVKTLEEMKDQWDRFGAGFEAFSLWISDKEKQLDVMKSSTLPLEEQIGTVKVQAPRSINCKPLTLTAHVNHKTRAIRLKSVRPAKGATGADIISVFWHPRQHRRRGGTIHELCGFCLTSQLQGVISFDMGLPLGSVATGETLRKHIRTCYCSICVFIASTFVRLWEYHAKSVHPSEHWNPTSLHLRWAITNESLFRFVVVSCACMSACSGRRERTRGQSWGSVSAGDGLPGPGPVRVLGGGGSHQGPSDPNRQVLGGAEGERAAARRAAGGKLVTPAEVQCQPGWG